MQNHRNHSKLKEIFVPILATVAVIIIFSPWLVVAYAGITEYTGQLLPEDQAVIRGFIEWFGTAYSFFLALAVVNVWSSFDTVDREFDRELDALAALLQTLKLTAEVTAEYAGQVEEFRTRARGDVLRYIDHVVKYHKTEWEVSEQKRNGDLLLQKIGGRIGEVTRAKMILEPYVYELFQSYNEAVDVRGDRISHSKPYTPAIIKVVAVVSSMVWLFSFLALVIYDSLLQSVLIGGVAFVIIMVLIIFFDLGSPFGGIWKIHLEDWQEFRDGIDHEEDPHLFFISGLKRTLAEQAGSLFGRENHRFHEFPQQPDSLEHWLDFLKRVRTGQSDSKPAIPCQVIHDDEQERYCCVMNGDEAPKVVMRRGLVLEEVLSCQQIRTCANVAEFEVLFDQEVKKHLDPHTA